MATSASKSGGMARRLAWPSVSGRGDAVVVVGVLEAGGGIGGAIDLAKRSAEDWSAAGTAAAKTALGDPSGFRAAAVVRSPSGPPLCPIVKPNGEVGIVDAPEGWHPRDAGQGEGPPQQAASFDRDDDGGIEDTRGRMFTGGRVASPAAAEGATSGDS